MSDLPRTTLRDRVRFYPLFDCYKHDLSPDPEQYATDRINRMTNSELLEAISFALEEMEEAGRDLLSKGEGL